tara:strand:+ start:640 stop:903 length:264 start_codon:yes stop_codon:yes gene_type:complete
MNEIRLSKEMKHMLLQLMAHDDTPKRMAYQVYNEFVLYGGTVINPYPKLLKDTIRLLKHCDNYWDADYVEEFIVVMKELEPDLEVTV